MAPAFETFIHVSDLAAAHSDSIDYRIGGGESIALNLGTGMAPA
jgi:UDP-glucose 4-epimerase